MIRINKYIANCGVTSRRNADKLIAEGKVKINGVVTTELGVSINENNDSVMVDDVLINPVAEYTYIMFNKPKGCVTTVSDDRDRKTVFDYIDIPNVRLYPVGRLDYDSEGLLLLTNDGNIAFKLTHPSKEVGKKYVVKITGEIKESELAQLRKGVVIDGVKTAKCKVKLTEFSDDVSRLELVIFEGKNRQIRKMFDVVNKEVVFLKRVAVGDLKLGGLGRGAYRNLNDYEVEYLKTL
ncbi:MAG: pseudouridine synthase [Clostridia bacterium]